MDVNHAPFGPARVRRAVLVGVLIVFGALGVARLNAFCLLEPDAADYLFTSRALATFQGYREIDHPEEPLHAFRPPGLPVLLTPVSLLSPYDVVAGKLVVLVLTLVMLALLYGYAERAGRTGLASLVLVAAGPYTLLHATEVMSEVPYIACSLGVLWLIARRDGAPRRAEVAAVTGLLAALPFLRTIGLALILAVVVWSLIDRSRRRWLVAAIIALVPALLWAWRNGRTGAPTYFTNFAFELSQSGPAAVVGQAALETWHYLDRLVAVFLPGLRPGQPLYERVLSSPSPDLGGLWGLALPIGLIAVGLSLLGMLRRDSRGGRLVAIYGALFLLALAVYPPKQERLAWPLVPLLWVYLPLGLRYMAGLLERRAASALAPARAAALLLAVGLVGWQGLAVGAMVSTNLKWLRQGDRFYETEVPPLYYSDWQAAGRWIHDHAPPHARVLTRHSDVGFTARRYQDAVRFEEVAPAEWRGRIAKLGARYLVVPTTLFGRFFRQSVIDRDPVYAYTPVYEGRNVMVLEVGPNRSGVARVEDRVPDRALEDCQRAADRHPARVDLKNRLAELLHETGRGEEAVRLLDEWIRHGADDVLLHKTLGNILLDLGRNQEALDRFRTASSLPEAGQLSSTLDRGIRRARQALGRSSDESPEARARELADRARRKMEVLEFEDALRNAEAAASLAPSDPSVRFVEAEVLQRIGRAGEAERAFERAAAAGHPLAEDSLGIIRLVRGVESGRPQASPDAHTRAALLLAGEGLPGRGLALLERGLETFPESREIRIRLADLYRFYGRADRAEPLCRAALETDPSDAEARLCLETLSRLLTPSDL